MTSFVRLLIGILFLAGTVHSFWDFFDTPFAPFFFHQHQQSQQQNLAPKPKTTPYRCLQYPDSGNCTQYKTRFYFNKTSGVCEPFAYGGCLGNENRFQSEVECLSTCYCTSPRCFLNPETGPCRANRKRYFYDHTKGICQPFTYGGCRGNANRFETEGECSATCKCPACVHTSGHCSGYHYNQDVEKCIHLAKHHCTAQPNVFDTHAQCDKQCSFCNLPKDPGHCNYPFYKNHYYYDSTARMCKPFYYGGCGGNKNRFMFEEQCQVVCGGGLPIDGEREPASSNRRSPRIKT